MQKALMRSLRAFVAAAMVAATGGAHASATLTNFSDLWWNPDESGWGLNIAQQADLMYVTFYVFDRSTQPTWYAAVLLHQGTQPSGAELFAGPVYRSTGPHNGGVWDATEVKTTAIGQAQFRATSTTQATMSWQINDGGIPLATTSSVQRFTLRDDNLGGTYVGATSDVTLNCANPANNGLVTNETGAFTVVHVGTAVEIRGPRCTYSGARAQTGQTSRIEGRYSCNDGAAGSFQFFDVKIEPGGLVGRYTGTGSFCEFAGNIGLGRRK